MTQNKKQSAKKKSTKVGAASSQARLPLQGKIKDNAKDEKLPPSKLVFQLKTELARHQKRDREWKLLFNMLAHDLKEPLLTLEGFTQLLEEPGGLSKEQKDYLRVIRESVGSLHLLIGSLQSITKLYQDPTDLVEISLKQLLDSITSALSEQIKRNKGKIILPEKDLKLQGDPARLYQILLNLIANSLKYHQKGINPVITIKHRKTSQYNCISVQDNGVGIESKDMERIFAPFTRLEEVMADGLGLGLSIVKKIAETCGGKISVRSKQNEGTTFTIHLPRGEKKKS